MKGPYVIIKPVRCNGRGLNKFYRICLNGELPKNHHSRPAVRVAVKSLSYVMTEIYRPRKWREHA